MRSSIMNAGLSFFAVLLASPPLADQLRPFGVGFPVGTKVDGLEGAAGSQRKLGG